jgi:hypothetical protein
VYYGDESARSLVVKEHKAMQLYDLLWIGRP